MLAPWTALACFQMCSLDLMTEVLSKPEMFVAGAISLFAMLGAIIFFGFGFDGCRAKAQ